MTAVVNLSQEQRLLLAGALFLAAISVFALCLYQHFCRSSLKLRAYNDALFAVVFVLCALYTASVRKQSLNLSMPWIIIPTVSFFAAAYSVVGLRREYREKKHRLSPASVKEALDNLNMGLLFADETGKTVLVNKAMASLYSAITGNYPQTLQELTSGLSDPLGDAVELIDKDYGLYRFRDGSVWSFQTVSLSDSDLCGFTQTMALNMAELYEANRQLEAENESLRSAIARMRKMLDRVAERSKEQETLNLKMRIHNDIGASLVSLSRLMEENDLTDTEAQIEILENAASFFAGGASAQSETLEDVFRQAEKLGVRLEISEDVPPNPALESIIASAIKECVTNCARHARGKNVSARITERGGIFTATITNDGEPPRGPIKEGGGLSSLRKKIEGAGGKMYIETLPAFALIVSLSEKELE